MNREIDASTVGYPEHLARQLEEYLQGLKFGEDAPVSLLREAMMYSLLAGGKRIRPVLLMASGIAFGREPREMLPTAAAMEMIHTYSLIHDDLPAFDDDDLRRGQPACHIRYGENVAILAGDALFAEAFRLICDEQRDDPAVVLAVMGEIALATGVKGMVGGQFLDVYGIEGEGPGTVRLLHSLKTGRLIIACVRCGAMLAGVSGEELESLTGFAAELGLLFQIKDDILDVVGDTATLGKKAGTDERLERHTYVSVYGLDEAAKLAENSRDKALDALSRVNADTRQLEVITNFIYDRQQ